MTKQTDKPKGMRCKHCHKIIRGQVSGQFEITKQGKTEHHPDGYIIVTGSKGLFHWECPFCNKNNIRKMKSAPYAYARFTNITLPKEQS
jgi:hypothetical protein